MSGQTYIYYIYTNEDSYHIYTKLWYKYFYYLDTSTFSDYQTYYKYIPLHHSSCNKRKNVSRRKMYVSKLMKVLNSLKSIDVSANSDRIPMVRVHIVKKCKGNGVSNYLVKHFKRGVLGVHS